MAGSAVTELKVKVGVTGDKNLTRLSRSLSNLGRDTAKANFNFKRFSAVLQEKEKRAVKSVNTTRQFSAAWKELANSVRIGSNEFKIATQEAARLDAQLAKAQARKGMTLGGMARGAGAVAAAGVFGGPEGAVGAGVGAVMGGPVGAAVGGAIGAQVGMVRQAIGETATYSAALARQRKALRLVIADTKAYTKAQDFLSEKSEKLAIPQDVIVRQFTALTASVKGAGHSVEDAEKVFESIASGIRGTGGSLEDMRAAMVATAQVFSKGKVSAEELRQQLGERLPGAFTIFAQSMNKTPAELDKALEQGKVTLNDFMNFSETLFKKYGESAEILAAGPEAAGDRLAVSMSVLKDEVGKMLQPIGAAFQNWSKIVVDSITDIIKELNKLFGIGKENKLRNLERELSFWKGIQEQTNKVNENLKKLPGGDIWGLEGTRGFEGTNAMVASLEAQIAALKDEIKEAADATNDLNNATKDLGKKGVTVWENMKAGGQAYLDSLQDVTTQMQSFFEGAFKKMEDALVDFVMTGKMNFAEFTRSILADLARISIRQAMTGTLGLFGISASPNAKGNIYAQNGIVPFAKGGVVNSPHIFPFRNGIGLMGEAGPEAIMPLRRGPGGRLGVESAGGGNNIVVNVDASGSSVEGNGNEAQQLGSAIAAAIQKQLVEERRPGGLLYA